VRLDRLPFALAVMGACSPPAAEPAARPSLVSVVGQAAAAPSAAPGPRVPSPFRVAALPKGPFQVTSVEASDRSRFGILAGAPVEVFAHEVKLRADLLVGVMEHFQHDDPEVKRPWGVNSIGGRWPHAAYMGADDSFVGDLFEWRGSRWHALNPKRLMIDSGGYLERWKVAPWKREGILALHWWMFRGEWKLLRGGTVPLPSLPKAAAPCDSVVAHIADATWFDSGEVVAVGPKCGAANESQSLALHWTGSSHPEVVALPDVPDARYFTPQLVAISTSEIYAFGAAWVAAGKTQAYVARFDGSRWQRLEAPAVHRDIVGHAPGDGKLYLSDEASLWVRNEGRWQPVPLPHSNDAPPDTKVRVGGVWHVDGSLWIGASFMKGRDPNPKAHAILHAGSPVIVDDDAIAAAKWR